MAHSVSGRPSFLGSLRRAAEALRRRIPIVPGRGETKQLSPTLQARCVHLSKYQIYVDTADDYIGRRVRMTGRYERCLTRFLHKSLKPGMGFLDIGANIGFHTMTGAHLVGPTGRVHAIEMSPTNCLLIKESIAANGYRHVTLHETAVSSEDGAVPYCATPHSSNCTVFSQSLRGKVGEAHPSYVPQGFVPMTTVDKLIPGEHRIDLVKLDVEGYELHVLHGMERVLRESRPTIVFEFFPGLLRDVGAVDPADLLNCLRGHHYQFRLLRSRRGAMLSNAQIMEHLGTEPLVDLVATREA